MNTETMVAEKLARRGRRTEHKRKHRILRFEFDAKAIRKRALHHKKKAEERSVRREINTAMMQPVKKQESFLSRIKNKLLRTQQKHG